MDRDQHQPVRALPYRTELARQLASLVDLWWSPAFRDDLVSSIDVQVGSTDSRIIWELGSRGPTRPSALATAIGLGAPSISKGIARLRTLGLVDLQPDPADGRATLVGLTEAGVDTSEQLYAVGDRMIAQIVSHWDNDDVRAFTALTTRFLADATLFARAIDGRTASSAPVGPHD